MSYPVQPFRKAYILEATDPLRVQPELPFEVITPNHYRALTELTLAPSLSIARATSTIYKSSQAT